MENKERKKPNRVGPSWTELDRVTHSGRFQKAAKQIKRIAARQRKRWNGGVLRREREREREREEVPGDPSEEEEDRDAMAGLGAEIGDDLRNLSEAPTEETYNAEPERHVVSQIAKTVLEIRFNPSHTCLLLLHTIPTLHSLSLSLSLSTAPRRTPPPSF